MSLTNNQSLTALVVLAPKMEFSRLLIPESGVDVYV